jgi:SANTA (SANT Associated)
MPVPRARAVPAAPQRLTRWFVSPVAASGLSRARGPLRVWGYAADGRLWRSSSVIETRGEDGRQLVTRYGTRVMLDGKADVSAAVRSLVPTSIARLFETGFPKGWLELFRNPGADDAKQQAPAQPTEVKKRRTRPSESAKKTKGLPTRPVDAGADLEDSVKAIDRDQEKPPLKKRKRCGVEDIYGGVGGGSGIGNRSGSSIGSSSTARLPANAIPTNTAKLAIPSQTRAGWPGSTNRVNSSRINDEVDNKRKCSTRGNRSTEPYEDDDSKGGGDDGDSNEIAGTHAAVAKTKAGSRRKKGNSNFRGASANPAVPAKRPRKHVGFALDAIVIDPLPEVPPAKRRGRPKRVAAEKCAPVIETENADDGPDGDDDLLSQQPPPPLVQAAPVAANKGRRKSAISAGADAPAKFTAIQTFDDADNSDAELFPGTPMAKTWSQTQLDAYAERRQIVPSNAHDMWSQIAEGVDGKTADECQGLWDSKWDSPLASQSQHFRASTSEAAGSKKSSAMASTPEIASQMAGARPAARRTAKYKSNARHVAGAMKRDIDDDELEPVPVGTRNCRTGAWGLSPDSEDIVCGALGALGFADDDGDIGIDVDESDGEIAPLSLAVQLSRGTPDTAAKTKRVAAERAGETQTPEVLARGRSFGLKEADDYASLFARRLAEAAKVAKSAPSAGFSRGEKKGKSTMNDGEAAMSPQPVDDLPVNEARASADDGDSEESDLFF